MKNLIAKVALSVIIAVGMSVVAFAALLPSGYQEVEYIESTGAQWLDTGYVPNASKTGVIMRFNSGKYVKTTTFFGTGWGSGRYLLEQQIDSYYFHDGGRLIAAVSEGHDMTVTIVPDGSSGGTLTIDNPDGTEWPTPTVSLGVGLTLTGADTLKIFGFSNGYRGSFRLYRFTITERTVAPAEAENAGEVLQVAVHDFVPCYRKDTGVIGLYDILAESADMAFKTGGDGSSAFLKGESVYYEDLLQVCGAPIDAGTVTPAYGYNEGYGKGDAVPCSASPVWTNDAETIAATCAGYKVYVNGVETESKSANSFTYVHPDSPKGAKLVWQWDVKYKMTVSAGEGGTVDTDEEWVDAGGTITLTATPGDGNSFYRWTGDIGDADPSAATITVPADRPRQLTATFGLARYVGGESGDYATLEAALQGAVGGDTIVLRKDTYTTAAEIVISDDITIRGETGDPADVIVKASGSHRMFTLNSPGAKLSGLTVSGGRVTTGNGAGVFIGTNGGMVEKCAVLDCQCNSWHLMGSGIYIAANSPGLVDSCVVSGCSTTRSDFSGGLAIALDGGEVRNCIITGNSLSIDFGTNGGSVYVNGGRLVNCTVTGNTMANCPGVWAVQGEVVNCIIAENTRTTATGADAVTWAGEASCFDHCVGTSAMNDTCTVVEHPFVDSAHGDYTPVIGTAAVDGGVAEDWMSGATDCKDNARVSGVAPDVGAVEYDQTSFSAGFRADVTAGKAPLTVTFTVTALGATGDLTCHWDLDGDGIKETTSAGATFTYVFENSGAVNVGLSVADGGGKSCDAQLPMQILAFGDEIRVNKTSTAPAFPYDTWEKAAASLEEALAVAYEGSEIVVSNNTYETAAEIQILKGVTIRGLTGDPEDVVFKAKGNHRMFWIDNPGAKLSGVTVSGGVITAGKGGGIYIDTNGGTVEKCVVRDCQCNVWQSVGSGIYIAAGSDNGLVDACVITGCSPTRGDFLGGMAMALDGGVARNCLVVGNVSENAFVGAVRVNGGELVNCTVTGNKTAGCPGVWAGSGKVVNCIIAENTHKTSTDPKTITWSGEASCFDHCVGTDAMNGSCEVLAHPFADPEHGDYSPVLGAAAVDTGVTEDWMDGAKDLLGNDRVSGSDPDIGAIEYDQSQFTASFSAAVSSGKAPLVVEFEVQTVGATGGITCFWDWDGDGEADAETDGSTSHTFETATYAEVRLTVKDNNSKKVVEVPLPVRVKAFGEAICVVKDNANAAPPYDSWANAAADLVTAYDFAEDECEIVVSNGTYETASVIQILKEVTLRGVSGNPEDVVIQATGSHRMFWLDNPKAKLSGLTVKGGVLVASSDGGGGVYIGEAGGTVEKCVICDCQCNDWQMVGSGIYIAAGSGKGLVDSCVIRGCSTARSDFLGGLAIALDGGMARNCIITGNNLVDFSLSSACGAVRVNGGELVNCTVAGNTSVQCPGVVAVSGKVVNCLIAENVNTTSSDAKTVTWSGEASCFDHCVGTDAMNESCAVLAHPFADSAHGDYSPLLGTAAVDHGVTEDWMDGARDFLGNDRVSGTAPDIGAIEYDQSRLSVGFAAEVSLGKAPLTVTFTVTAVGATGELSCAWDLDGDGDTDATSDGTSFTYTFEDPCAVNVGLHVVDGGSGQECDAALPRRICAFGQAILVSTMSPSPAEPYDTWTNAATNFEDAVAIACADVDVVVSNGTYMTEEEIILSDAITIRGLTGDPADAVIRAQGEHRVFRLDNSGAKLSGLTVAGGTMSTSSGVGGGIYIGVNGGTVEKCVIRECKCTNWATSGGGIYIAPGADRGLVDSCVITECGTTRGDFAGGLAMTLDGGMARNCLVTGNHFEYSVNAACGSVRVNGGELVNCTVAGNDCVNCPGVVALSGKVVNCAIGENVTQDTSKTYNTCWAGTADCFNRCIGPVKINDNCFEGENLFVDAANGDFRLAKDSPALDKGVKEPWMKGDGKDFFGQKRISHFRPDLGFHELQVYNGFKISVK